MSTNSPLASAEAQPLAAQSELKPALLVSLLLAAAQAPLGSTLISVGLPSISRTLGTELAETTHWLVTSYLIINIVGQGPGGRITDALGQLRAVRLGMRLQLAGGVLGVLAQSLWLLVLARCAIAAGAALVMPACVAWLRDKSPEARRGRVFGWLGATLSLSAAIGPPLGGLLLGWFGYRAVFAAPLALWAVSALLLHAAGGPQPAAADPVGASRLRAELDPTGSLLLTAALASLLLGNAHPLAALAAFGLLCALFAGYELRSARPLLDPRLFRLRGFAAGGCAVALQNFVMYGLLFQVPNFFEHVRGVMPRAIGNTLFLMMLGMVAASAVGGRLCDRLGARNTALLGLLPAGAGIVFLQRLAAFVRPSDAALGLALLGFGLGLLNAPIQTSVLAEVERTRTGMAAGASATLRYLGGVLAIFMLRVLLDAPDSAALLRAHAHAVQGFGCAAMLLACACLALPGRATKLPRH